MSHPDESEILDDLIALTEAGDWKSVLLKHRQNKQLPWIWPSEENLNFIGRCVNHFKAKRIVSIGCGSGLFEWLIQQVTGIPVKGVEVDKSWWNSKCCKHKFIPLEFAEEFSSGYEAATQDDVILFCYFNNEPAFLSYMRQFKGTCLIVIGPEEYRDIHTDPNPFHLPGQIASNWRLHEMQELSSGRDFIGVFSLTTPS